MNPSLKLVRGLCAILAFSALTALRADPIISEFMASNKQTLADADGRYSDWIELHNPDATAVSLDGWYLTDDAKDLKKWQIPAITLPPGGYVVVFASDKNRRDPTRELHTNFELDANSEYLALVKPDGRTAVTEFSPKFPDQFDDMSYGITQTLAAGETPITSYFRVPTPRARNGGIDTQVLPERVLLSRASGPFTGSLTVTLSGAGAGQRIRYVLIPPSSAGVVAAEPTASSTPYTGPITIQSSTLLRASVFSADDRQSGRSISAQYVRMGNSGATRVDNFSSQLPLMVIDLHGTGALEKDGLDRPAWMYTWNKSATATTALTALPAETSRLSINVRGSSSAEFPKKGFTIRMVDSNGRASAHPIFGLPSFDTWVLVGPWTYDPTYLHNVLMYELSNRMGRWAPRTQVFELFLNSNGGDLDTSDYAGLYVFTDALRIDRKRIDLEEMAVKDVSGTAVTGGYLMKFDVPAPEDFSFQTRRNYPGPPNALIVTSPGATDLVQAQREYIQGYVQSFEDALQADLAANWRQRTHLNFMDRDSWVDYHILNTLSMNADGFVRSAYLMKDRGEKLVAGPLWDYDRALAGGDPRTIHPETWAGGDGSTEPWTYGWWGILAKDPDFMQAWIDRWQRVRKDALASTTVAALLDGYATQIGTAAPARDAARWPTNAIGEGNTPRFPGAWLGEIENLKSFLRRRSAWIDSKFSAPPTLTNVNGVLTITPAPGTRLAYTTNGTDPRASGGGVASGATLAAGPVTLSNAVNLQARSYNSSFNPNTIPGSAWSSAVNNPGRLVNLSILTDLAASDTFTMGFVVGGADTAGRKALLARAAGPSLTPLGVTTAHTDPKLELFAGSTKLSENDNWGGAAGVSNAFVQVGAFAYVGPTSRDAAVFDPAVAPGNNSIIVSGVGTASGTVIAELYDATPAATIGAVTPRLVNVSVLKTLGAGCTAGFVIGPGSPKNVLIRAIGPSLKSLFGVAESDDDPQLTLFAGETKIGDNNDWGGKPALKAAFAKVGAFALPDSSSDAALLANLAPGNYTVQVKGEKAAGGIALIEVYEVP